MQAGERVHWFRIIAELRASGRSVQSIAAELGLARMTVNDWVNGAHPRHADGERLLAIWMRELGTTRDQVPIIEESSFKT